MMVMQDFAPVEDFAALENVVLLDFAAMKKPNRKQLALTSIIIA